MSEEDNSLFLEAMQDVTPLNETTKQPLYNQGKVSHTQKEVIKRVKRKQKVYKTSLETDNPHKLDKAKHVTKVTTFESLFYHQKGIRLQELSKLKKGDFTVQAVLDLHGLTIDQAEIESLDFIHRAYQEYFRYIRIIHGKGYNSDDSYPALKNLVNQILRQTKLVLAFSSTPEKDGGTGAVNIFLKSH